MVESSRVESGMQKKLKKTPVSLYVGFSISSVPGISFESGGTAADATQRRRYYAILRAVPFNVDLFIFACGAMEYMCVRGGGSRLGVRVCFFRRVAVLR